MAFAKKKVDKKAEFLKELKILQDVSVYCEGEWDGKSIQTKLYCAGGSALDALLDSIAKAKAEILRKALRR